MPANDVRYALEALAKSGTQERKNNPPNGSLEMIQDQPIQQSRGKELNPTNGSLRICSSPTFSEQCRLWDNVRHWVCLP